jgi:hypothetical protein
LFITKTRINIKTVFVTEQFCIQSRITQRQDFRQILQTRITYWQDIRLILQKKVTDWQWQHFHLKFQDMSPGPGKKWYTIYIQKLRN